MKKIIIHQAKPISALLAESNLHKILKQIYANRDIQSLEQIETNLSNLLPFYELKNIQLAVDILLNALKQQVPILIIGDYDADGATSVVLAIKALKRFGMQSVDFFIPDRFTEGHGLATEIVEYAKSKQIKLIMTVDNGMASHEAVALAKTYGIQVIITDHHLPAATLPAADAVINPNQEGDNFPSKNLAGVGVIFYLMLALRAALRELKWFELHGINEPNLADYLDLVALGTIADMVPLDQNNRILVDQGVRRIRAGKCSPGISALLTVAKRNLTLIKAEDLGFSIAPRLNAAGRLKHMNLGVQCLLADDWVEARSLAVQMEKLNQERRSIELSMHHDALNMLKKDQTKQSGSVVCLFNENWHQGVIGILATRMKNKINCPVAVFTKQDNELLRGSIRSVDGVHIYEVLSNIATQYPSLINQFGGHAMAAGLSLKRTSYADFQQILAAEIKCKLNNDDLVHEITTDGELSAAELSLELASLLDLAGPWGKDFPEPTFVGHFQIKQKRLLQDKHLKMVLETDGKSFNAIAFNIDKDFLLSDNKKVMIVYRLTINDFQGKKELQLLVEYIGP